MSTADRMREVADRARKEEIKASAEVIDECVALVLARVKDAAEAGRGAVDVVVPGTVPARNKEIVVGAVRQILRGQGFSVGQGFSAGHRDGWYSWWVRW